MNVQFVVTYSNFSLDDKLCIRDDKMLHLYLSSPSLAVVNEHGLNVTHKR